MRQCGTITPPGHKTRLACITDCATDYCDRTTLFVLRSQIVPAWCVVARTAPRVRHGLGATTRAPGSYASQVAPIGGGWGLVHRPAIVPLCVLTPPKLCPKRLPASQHRATGMEEVIILLHEGGRFTWGGATTPPGATVCHGSRDAH